MHSWLSSQPCPNWSDEIFKKSLWPESSFGKLGRELPPGYQSYAFPLIGLSPSKFILLEFFLDFLWKVPLNEKGQSEVDQVHLDFSLAMTSKVYEKNDFTPTLPDINGGGLLFAPQNFRAKFINFKTGY